MYTYSFRTPELTYLSRPIVSNSFCSRPLSATQVLPLYIAYPAPRPSLIYLPDTNPPSLLFNLTHGNLLFLLTASSEIEPLLALEFLHRVVDILEEFVGAPLTASKLEDNYDVVAQLLNEMCDAGIVATTEGNALRDLVEVEGWIGKLLGGISLPGKPGFTPSSGQSSSAMPGISSLGASTANAHVVPWRRANVRHTSNELYVDLVETLSVIIAPSGRPISAFANGTIAFTSKVSGVPDLLLTLSSPSGRQNFESVMDLPVFHPCVRLARWRERPGELSFVPPDGRFVLAGYEVDLLPLSAATLTGNTSSLKLPVNIEVITSLGTSGADFEVRLTMNRLSGPGNTPAFPSIGRSTGRGGAMGGTGFGNGGAGSGSASPTVDDLVITIPIPSDVRNLTDIRASRGDTTYNPGDKTLDWSIRSKDTTAGVAVLRCTVVGTSDNNDEEEGNTFSFDASGKNYDYNEDASENGGAYQTAPAPPTSAIQSEPQAERDERLVEKNKVLMPTSARVSFTVKGWLPSGIKVESLNIDQKRSRGLGDGVKPFKGVKYLSVSNGGLEVRC